MPGLIEESPLPYFHKKVLDSLETCEKFQEVFESELSDMRIWEQRHIVDGGYEVIGYSVEFPSRDLKKFFNVDLEFEFVYMVEGEFEDVPVSKDDINLEDLFTAQLIRVMIKDDRYRTTGYYCLEKTYPD